MRVNHLVEGPARVHDSDGGDRPDCPSNDHQPGIYAIDTMEQPADRWSPWGAIGVGAIDPSVNPEAIDPCPGCSGFTGWRSPGPAIDGEHQRSAIAPAPIHRPGHAAIGRDCGHARPQGPIVAYPRALRGRPSLQRQPIARSQSRAQS